jgi:hypothetical protein
MRVIGSDIPNHLRRLWVDMSQLSILVRHCSLDSFNLPYIHATAVQSVPDVICQVGEQIIQMLAVFQHLEKIAFKFLLCRDFVSLLLRLRVLFINAFLKGH